MNRHLAAVRVRGVECQYMRLGDPDKSGRRSTHPVPGTEFVLEVDTVIKAIGQKPRGEFAEWLQTLRGTVEVIIEEKRPVELRYIEILRRRYRLIRQR